MAKVACIACGDSFQPLAKEAEPFKYGTVEPQM
jgi:hypothetical protein